MNNFGEKVAFIWSIADLIRDMFKRGKYQDVILPLTVLRRIDCVLEPTKDAVLAEYEKHAALETPQGALEKILSSRDPGQDRFDLPPHDRASHEPHHCLLCQTARNGTPSVRRPRAAVRSVRYSS